MSDERFSVRQEFSEGFDPDDIARAFVADLRPPCRVRLRRWVHDKQRAARRWLATLLDDLTRDDTVHPNGGD